METYATLWYEYEMLDVGGSDVVMEEAEQAQVALGTTETNVFFQAHECGLVSESFGVWKACELTRTSPQAGLVPEVVEAGTIEQNWFDWEGYHGVPEPDAAMGYDAVVDGAGMVYDEGNWHVDNMLALIGHGNEEYRGRARRRPPRHRRHRRPNETPDFVRRMMPRKYRHSTNGAGDGASAAAGGSTF